jgi:hypothetical protein
LQAEKLTAEYEAHKRGMLAGWSDVRLREAVASVEAGNCDAVEGWVARTSPPNRFDMESFELRFLREELERRGWPPFRQGPVCDGPLARFGAREWFREAEDDE